MKNLASLLLVCFAISSHAQTNFVFSDSTIPDILQGNYNADDYAQETVIDDPAIIFNSIQGEMSSVLLRDYVSMLESFGTRHTSSDTLSDIRGIGATRNWVMDKYVEFSQENEDRLIPFFFQFDQDVCGLMDRHKNSCAILPGTDPNSNGIILVEAHMDSRCEGRCDIDCPAPGADDNGSGTALLLEMARLMSRFSYEHTILFMATTGEEQGLIGAEAFATYCVQEGVDIKAVFNNDVVGGIICGETSSPPSCPFEGAIDSTQVRMFSSGNDSKQLVRWIKLEYTEELLPISEVPMMLTVMGPLDRAGRGGDHIPFFDRGYRVMRYTSANEHGDANVDDPDYHDHQHTTNDLLGFDTDGDGVRDSLFVDFNYLARNTMINVIGAGAAATGPSTPRFDFEIEGDSIRWTVEDPLNLRHYRVARRSTNNDFDTVFTFQNATTGLLPRLATPFFDQEVISGAGVDADGIESFFGTEEFFLTLSATSDPIEDTSGYELLQNAKNPFSSSTLIQYKLGGDKSRVRDVSIVVTDVVGKEIDRIEGTNYLGINSFNYYAKPEMKGSYFYSLEINGTVILTKQMIIL